MYHIFSKNLVISFCKSITISKNFVTCKAYSQLIPDYLSCKIGEANKCAISKISRCRNDLNRGGSYVPQSSLTLLHRTMHGSLITPQPIQPIRRIATAAAVYLANEKAIERVRAVQQSSLFYRQQSSARLLPSFDSDFPLADFQCTLFI